MKRTGKHPDPKPTFDPAGYQTNIHSLNGEPLPDLTSGSFQPFCHGGRRPGAGRKPSGNEPVLLRLQPRLIRRIRRLARVQEKDNSRVATELLELGLKRAKA
jgi:hypothetical protein